MNLEKITNMTVEEYRNHPALNFSTLAALDKGPQYLLKYRSEYTDAMKLGSVVDCLITDPNSFDERFVVATIDKPTGQMGEFVDELLQLIDGDLDDFWGKIDEFGLTAYEKVGFKRDSFEKVKERFEKEGKAYFEFVLNSQGKEVISVEEHVDCSRLASTIMTHQFTSKYFVNDTNTENLYQTAIVFTCRGTQYKCLLDLIRINHKERTIQPLDIKTMGEGLGMFKSSIWKYRYDIQSSLYLLAVHDWKMNNEKIKDYTVLPFKFIVGSFLNGKVCVFNADKLFHIGANGGETSWGTKIKGWVELTNLYNWHMENQKFDYTKELYDNQGEVILEA